MGHQFKHEGRSFTLTLSRGKWRLRCRAEGRQVDFSTKTGSVQAAVREAKKHLEGHLIQNKLTPAAISCADILTAYNSFPKRASDASAKINGYRWKALVREVTGKELENVPFRNFSRDWWDSYMAKKLGGKLDLSTRRPGNSAINSAVRCAAALFIPRLRPLYKKQGIEIPEDATVIQWLPEMKLPRSAVSSSLLLAWRRLRKTDRAMWLTIGLARCAGLRRDEIEHITRAWIVQDKGNVWVEIRDRPEEGYLNKTGESYRALVLSPTLAQALVESPPGLIVQPDLRGGTGKAIERHRWFERFPQRWLKAFVGNAPKPLHRLRGLYLDNVKKRTESAFLARQAGIKAAADAAGHTTTRTTVKHYLSGA
jgi:hypothetical protein